MANYENNINVICLESRAFYELIDRVVERIGVQQQQQDHWISDVEAMRLLRIKSTTTLQKYRDEGKIRFSQPSRKVILYDRASLLEFLEQHAKETF